MRKHARWWLGLAILLAGCGTIRQTDPPVTATEQLLVSSAVDRSAGRLHPPIPRGSKVYLDANALDTDGVILPKYTIAAVRARLVDLGAAMVDDRKQAEVIVELRSGAQSIDAHSKLLGLPSLPLPIPFAGTLVTPEVALFKLARQTGISKVGINVYTQPEGRLLAQSELEVGESHQTRYSVLFFSRTVNDLNPPVEHASGTSSPAVPHP